MNLMSAEWRDRLDHWVRTLEEDIYEPVGTIPLEMFPTMEHLSLEEAAKGPFRRVEPGFAWGHTWEYGWFRGEIALPERARGKRIVMKLAPGGESTLFVNGREFGTYRADWVTSPLHYYEDNCLTRCARGNERYELYMETYAGHYYPEAPEGRCATGPVLPGSYQDPQRDGARRVLGECTYGIFHEEAYQLYMDVRTLELLMDTLEPTSLRAEKIADALEQFTLTVDFEQEREERLCSYREARQNLAGVLQARNGSTLPVFYAIGHAHLDLAWLWPMEETYRKTARTFAAQLRLLEEYPDYRYLQSQPAAYEMCRTYYPALFERIREAVKRGSWIPEGAMWVEPDTNLPSGESLIRQCLYGTAYFRQTFGRESEILWLPDSFGYSGCLPQILKGCGVKYLVTQKIFWTYNDAEPFPYHYFTWQGTDGSSVTAFLPTDYNYQTDPKTIQETWKKRRQLRDLDAFLLPFGYGDGGGGPTRDHIEFAEREKNLEGMPAVRMESPLTFFRDMEAKGGPANTYVGELYFQAHRGTYTSQAKTKRNNRLAENALREMELWGSAALTLGKAPSDKESLEEARLQAERLWKELLLHQFHDILPGSGIGRIYEEADRRVSALIREARRQTAVYQACFLDPRENGVTIWNAASTGRTAVVTLPGEFADGAADLSGNSYPVCTEQGETLVLVKVPAAGAITLVPDKGHRTAANLPYVRVERESADTIVMENRLVRAVVKTDPEHAGEIASFCLKDSSLEFASSPLNHLRLFKDVPRAYDAWDIDSCYRMQEIPCLRDGEVHILRGEAPGSLQAAVRVTGKIGDSELEQDLILDADRAVLRFETKVQWRELHRLLKASFPVTVWETEGYNEMQYGYVKRPTHRSRRYDQDRYEVCNHRYTALADGSHGAAVLNDCKYGISMDRNAMELSLLRAPASPQMRADNGAQVFTYAFTAWEGTFVDSPAALEGEALNRPLLVTRGALKDAETLQLVQINRPNVILDAIKLAEDGSGDLILRLYESKRCPGTVKIRTAWQGSVYRTDMLERVLEEIAVEDQTFSLTMHAFEVCTVRIHPEPGPRNGVLGVPS